MDTRSLKRAVHEQCLALLAQRITDMQVEVDSLRTSESDTKSSAGDKHETGRAMAQLEIEKHLSSIALARDMVASLERLDPDQHSTKAVLGALVATDTGRYYIAVPFGRIRAKEMDVHVISPQAPLALAFARTPIGGTARFNGADHIMRSIG